MEQFSWLSQSTPNRSIITQCSCVSQPFFESLSSVTWASEDTANENSLQEFPSDEILSHWFKQYKQRNAYPYFSLKLKANRFGRSISRRRVLIAPPMSGVAPSSLKPQPPVPSAVEQVQDLRAPPEGQDSTSTEETDLLKLGAWIEERKQLHNLLDNCVNLEEWLTEKKPITQQEESILRKMKERKEKVNIQGSLLDFHRLKMVPKGKPLKTTPLVRAPYPVSIITLQNLLHKQKIKLIELFKRADRTKAMKFKRMDFLRIIQETKVPISKSELEDIIVYLTLSRKGCIITAADLAECQRIWMDHVRENYKQPKQDPLPGVRMTSTTEKEVLIPQPRPSISSQVACQTKSNQLQVPPVNTEPDRRHLTYNQMEIVGKRYKETRRRLKRKTNPLDFADQCRLVRSGDPVVDGHCMPSTIEGEMGELVDQHRLACHYVYVQCVKLCEKYGIPISERILKKGLLYPGDRLLRLGQDFRKLRQPGGYCDIPAVSLKESADVGRSSSKVKKSKPKPKAIKKQVKRQTLANRWKSFKEFKELMSQYSKKLIPPLEYWKEKFGDSLLEIPNALAEKYVERELMRMFTFLNPLTNPNNFWPGHLLDKLCLCLPESRQDGSDPLFSRVSHTSSVYPGIYNPHRSWPVSNKGYVTLGDPESRKHYYYI